MESSGQQFSRKVSILLWLAAFFAAWAIWFPLSAWIALGWKLLICLVFGCASVSTLVVAFRVDRRDRGVVRNAGRANSH